MASKATSIAKYFLALFVVGTIANYSYSQGTGGVAQAGIDIDAEGVLHIKQFDARVATAQRQAALRSLPSGSVKSVPMRKVSLQRLEKALAKSIAEGKDISTELRTLAGLTRVEYVMYFPESKEIVIAGPAEQTIENPDGRLVGIASGHPTLSLDDLAVAMRAFRPNAKTPELIGCSIDPTQEGLARMQAFLKSLGPTITPDTDVSLIVSNLKSSLGLQNVTVQGVPSSTRFAQVLVEADYRMKLIGIGLEIPAIPFQSWVDRASPYSGSANAMQRWFFVADYSGVKVSPDSNALKLEGQGVKLVGEDERVDRNGKRTQTGKSSNGPSKAFTKDFSQKFEKLAEVTPVFYEMRNLFDLSVCMAYVKDQDFYGKSGWDLGVLGDESKFQIETASIPTQVETAVNAIWKGTRLMTPLGGGVQISARKIASSQSTQEDSKLADTQSAATVPADLEPNQWWWD